jgi:hypothetical protein
LAVNKNCKTNVTSISLLPIEFLFQNNMENKTTPPRRPYVPPHLRGIQNEDNPDKGKFDDKPIETTPQRNSTSEDKKTPIKSPALDVNTTQSASPTKPSPSANITPTRVAISLPPLALLTPEKTPTPSPAKSDTNTTPKSNSILSSKSPSQEWGYVTKSPLFPLTYQDESLEESLEKLKINETPPRRSPKTTSSSPRTPESPYKPSSIDGTTS